MYTILILAIGILIGYSLGRDHKSPQITKHLHTQKEKGKETILQHLQENERITNNEVEELLGIADSTATKYLQELEDEGTIEQIGNTGRNVKYKLKKD